MVALPPISSLVCLGLSQAKVPAPALGFNVSGFNLG